MMSVCYTHIRLMRDAGPSIRRLLWLIYPFEFSLLGRLSMIAFA
jgi:hypothetical protein